MYIYYSSDFQCPDTGVPVQLLWDPTEDGVMLAQISDSIDMDDELHSKEILRKTQDWCDRLSLPFADDLDEANDIAEKYDCWF